MASSQALAHAIESFALKSIENQGNHLEQIAKVTALMGDMMVKRAGQVIGKRGGLKAQANKRAAREIGACVTCVTGRGTSQEIVKHVTEGHEALRLAAARSTGEVAKTNGEPAQS